MPTHQPLVVAPFVQRNAHQHQRRVQQKGEQRGQGGQFDFPRLPHLVESEETRGESVEEPGNQLVVVPVKITV